MIKEKAITLDEILQSRDKRASIQNSFINKYKKTIISFTMNIAGDIKTNDDIESAFNIGKKQILNALEIENFNILEMIEIHENTGDELILSVSTTNSNYIKNLMMNIEEQTDLGRLFDIDVIDHISGKISRNNFRKCILCQNQAQLCVRSMAHPLNEVKKKTMEIIKAAIS